MDNVYLTYLPSDKFKTGFLSAQLVLPLSRSTAGRNALMVNVLGRGTRSYPDLAAISRQLDLLYGARLEPTVRKKGENQVVGFVASSVDDRLLPGGERLLEPLCALMGEMLTAPATENGGLRQDYVKSEGENLADLIRSDLNDKRSYAARRLMEEMCAQESYGAGRLGQADEVEALTAKELTEHYRATLPRARVELFYCGAASKDRVTAAFGEAFRDLPRSGDVIVPAVTTRRPAPETPRVVTEEMDVTQAKLGVGYRIDSDDTPGAMLMNTMFGGSSNAKLFLNVREKLSLCYYASSTYHRSKGMLTVSSGIDQKNYRRAMEEIGRQLEDLAQLRWEDWELQAARSALRNGLVSMEDSAGAMEDFSIGQLAIGSDETLEQILAGVEAVTEERVQAAAKSVRMDTVYFLKGKEGDAE
jgi:predicted Zn-dependent peptidase